MCARPLIHRLPQIAEWLVKQFSWFEDREAIVNNLTEEYLYRISIQGKQSAWLWVWMHVFRSILPLMIFEFKWRLIMLKSCLFIALRHIKHNKIYSLLNISGLAVGLSAFILIGLYVQYELSFDKYHENADRIYRVVRDEKAFTPAALAPALKEEFPEVEAFTRIIQENNILLSYGENHFLEETIHWAGPETFKIFTLPYHF